MADRRIAKAAHPIINAWRCRVGNTLYQGRRHLLDFARMMSTPLVSPLSDNDDDGESAAGGRLAHLLQILVSYSLVLPILLEYLPTGHQRCVGHCH